MIFLSAIHGIRTKLTSPSWPWRLQAYAVRQHLDVVMQADHYWANPLPFWNTHVLNPKHGRAVARRLELLKEEFPEIPISLVAHSNGGDIAVRAVKRLVDLGIDVDTIILIASAVESDIIENGLLPLIRRGHLKRAICYASRKDVVIKPLEWLPGNYGALGAKGWRRDDKPTGAILLPGAHGHAQEGFLTRWFNYSHGEYFEPEVSPKTFDMIARDLGLVTVDEVVGCSMNTDV